MHAGANGKSYEVYSTHWSIAKTNVASPADETKDNEAAKQFHESCGKGSQKTGYGRSHIFIKTG
ncbi:MAG: hypothetical protein V1802_01260 [Candidatus Aenigmatarchaeota archaeon]